MSPTGCDSGATPFGDEYSEIIRDIDLSRAPVGGTAKVIGDLSSDGADVASDVTEEVLIAKGAGIALKYTVSAAGVIGIRIFGSAGKGKWHHICTDKCKVADWTRIFDKIFQKAGMSLSDPLNKVYLVGHKGPHSDAYHAYVLRQIVSRVGDSTGVEYKLRLRGALAWLQSEAVRPNSAMRSLLDLP
jgi:hypothetical protein